jgi:hypothetical protein
MRKERLIGAGLVALGAGIAANAALGPLALGVIRFHNSTSGIDQLIGGEAVSLVVVAPLSVAAGVLWMRGHTVAPALALAPSLYALYTYTTLVLGPEYGRYPGNNERFLPLHLGILALSGAIAVKAWSALSRAQPPMPSAGLRITAGIALLAPNALFALAWIKQIADFLGGERSQAYRDDPRLWWLIKVIDLSLVIPASLGVGIGVLRRKPGAITAAYGLSGFLACLVGSVGSMGVVQIVKDDPSASPAVVVISLAAALGVGSVTARLIRAYITPDVPSAGHPAARREAGTTTA